MTRSTLPSDDGRLPVYPLRVLRVEGGAKYTVRFLRYTGLGCGLHWVGKRSQYCHGKECEPGLHKKPWQWVGFEPVETYDQRQNLWLPSVLQISEHAELDLRDRCERGQVWEFTRPLSIKNKHFPVSCKFLEQRPERSFPAPFDIVTCLIHCFHVNRVDLTLRNPLPSRTMVAPSRGEKPLAIDAIENVSPAIDADELAKRAELLAKIRSGRAFQVPQNGAHQ